MRDRVLLTHISELLAYADEHFSQEENIQAEIGFPFRDTHKREHENLTNQLHAIRINLESHQDYKWRESAVQGLFDALRDWLLNHILNEDLKMRDYFKRRKKTPRA